MNIIKKILINFFIIKNYILKIYSMESIKPITISMEIYSMESIKPITISMEKYTNNKQYNDHTYLPKNSHKKAGWFRVKFYFLIILFKIISSIITEIIFCSIYSIYGNNVDSIVLFIISNLMSLFIFNFYIKRNKIKIINSYFIFLTNTMIINVCFIKLFKKINYNNMSNFFKYINFLFGIGKIIDLYFNWNILLEKNSYKINNTTNPMKNFLNKINNLIK